MFTIGEFARLGGVTTRALRYYEQVGLLQPAEIDGDTGDMPPPVRHLILPPVQAATAVRRGAGAFPYVYQDLARWIDDHGYRPAAHGREIWLSTAAEAGGIEGQVVEVQLPFATEP